MSVELKVAQVSKADCGSSYCGSITIGNADPRSGGQPFFEGGLPYAKNYFESFKDVRVGSAQHAGPWIATENAVVSDFERWQHPGTVNGKQYTTGETL